MASVPLIASYSELSYFEGFHFHHIAAYQEHLRIKRLNKQSSQLTRDRMNSRPFLKTGILSSWGKPSS